MAEGDHGMAQNGLAAALHPGCDRMRRDRCGWNGENGEIHQRIDMQFRGGDGIAVAKIDPDARWRPRRDMRVGHDPAALAINEETGAAGTPLVLMAEGVIDHGHDLDRVAHGGVDGRLRHDRKRRQDPDHQRERRCGSAEPGDDGTGVSMHHGGSLGRVYPHASRIPRPRPRD